MEVSVMSPLTYSPRTCSVFLPVFLCPQRLSKTQVPATGLSSLGHAPILYVSLRLPPARLMLSLVLSRRQREKMQTPHTHIPRSGSYYSCCVILGKWFNLPPSVVNAFSKKWESSIQPQLRGINASKALLYRVPTKRSKVGGHFYYLPYNRVFYSIITYFLPRLQTSIKKQK